MNTEVKYLLDANIFIQAHQTYYAFDIAPSFWDKLIRGANEDKIISIDQIKSELESSHNDDLLSTWATNNFNEWFFPCSDNLVYQSYRDIIEWSQRNAQFYDTAKSEFASSADSWVLAYAKAHGCVIVTHETYDKNIKRRIKIPNVCEAFDIPYTDTFSMLRNLNIQIG